jgi:hypothetical protein
LPLLIFYSVQMSIAQDIDEGTQEVESELVEANIETTESEANAEILTEELQNLNQNPIDLNTSTDKDFEKIGILTPYQIYSIIEYRTKKGSFVSVYELNGIDCISTSTLQTLLPYVIVNPENITFRCKSKNRAGQSLLVRVDRTLEQQNGYAADSLIALYTNRYYPGNPYKEKLKYKFDYSEHYKAGFNAEKDPGETSFSGSNKTFDFTSGYLQVQNIRYLKNMIIGDYSISFGQGLVAWSGYATSRSAFSVNIRKTNKGFKAYSSSDENRYLRGVAATVRLGNFYISPFYSSKHIDANIASTDSNKRVLVVSSFQNTGIHALPGELLDEDALGEKTFGCNVSFEKGHFEIGSSIISTRYTAKIQKSNELYKRYSFSGNQLNSAGLNYTLRFRKSEFFGEIARNSFSGNALLCGVSLQAAPELSVAMLYRYFQPQYCSSYAAAFSQNTQPSNENGLYFGIEFIPARKLKINAYADFFRFPFPKYKISAPSSGKNYFIESTYIISDDMDLSARYSLISRQEDATAIAPNPPALACTNVQKTRFVITYKLSNSFSLRNRVELSNYAKPSENIQKGYYFSQDISWISNDKKYTLAGRYAFFHTDGWESRIYTYENDILYSYSIPALSGKGIRAYIMLRYHPKQNLYVWFRYATTIYSDRELIGSGPTQINGNQKSDAGLQVMIKF